MFILVRFGIHYHLNDELLWKKKENQNNFSINNFKFFVSSRTSGYPDDLLMNSLVSGIWNSCSSIGWESLNWVCTTAHKKMKFSITDFFSKFDQTCRKLRICSHLLRKSVMENFSFCVLCRWYWTRTLVNITFCH